MEARNALARELRKQGKPEEARRIAALRRPSPTLWIVNQLPKSAGDSVAQLIESTRKARRAQLQRGGDELREAMQSQREALQKLIRQAEVIAARIGMELTPEQQRRIQDTLETAAATQPDALREGTLEQELSAAGFSSLISGTEAASLKAAPRKGGSERPVKHDLEEKRRQLAEKRARMLREREFQTAQKQARRLAVQAQKLEKQAQQAQSAADQARSKATEARTVANGAASKLLQLQKP